MNKQTLTCSIIIAAAILGGAAFWYVNLLDSTEPTAPSSSFSANNSSTLTPTDSTETAPFEPVVAGLVSSRPNEVPNQGYLGSESCEKCHQDEHQSWHASYHRTMTQLISPATAPDVIKSGKVNVEDLNYEFTQKGDQFFVQYIDAVARRIVKREILMMTGSHHMHVFWIQSDRIGTPSQLPIVYLIDQKKWIPRRAAFLSPTEAAAPAGMEAGRWNNGCANCHSTHPRQRPNGSRSEFDTRVAEFGIACEACHGPGEEHVHFRSQSNEQTEDRVDPIVNPTDLPHEVQSDVCGRCHGINFFDTATCSADQFAQHGSPFRPGESLRADGFLKIVQTSPAKRKSLTFQSWNQEEEMVPSSFWPDGHVRVSGREYNGLIESQCFQKGEMSCLTCHTMHEQDTTRQAAWRDDQLKPAMRGDAACIECHDKYAELGSAHTHHAIDSTGSRCINCHMPHTVYGLLKTIRSHTISSPSVSNALETGRSTACNLCHLDHSLAETSKHLHKWYGNQRPELTNEQQTVSASVLHLLKGDAAQRSLQINAMVWPPARDASGVDWMLPYVLVAMDDSYEAIRLIAKRVFDSLEHTPPLQYDFLELELDRNERLDRVRQSVEESLHLPSNPALLINDSGKFDSQRIKQLLERRDQTPVTLME